MIAVVVVLVVAAAVALGFAASARERATSVPTTFPRPDAVDRMDLAARMPPAPAGFVVAPDDDGRLTAQNIVASAGRAGPVVGLALRRDGFVTGWRRGYVSPSGRERIRVSLYQMATTTGASDSSARSLQPWLARRGWSFAPVADGFGATALQRSIPDAAGTYGYVLAQPVARVVLLIETRSPDPQRMYDVMVDLVNVARPRVDD